MAAQRADARRNRTRILAVAREEVAAHGAEASLEQIARVAGVGSATVRRHFPNRRALLEAVFHERVEALCAQAREAVEEGDARTALLDWLGELTAYAASARGMAAALTQGEPAPPGHLNACAATLTEAADPLLRRAVREGAAAAGVTVSDLVTLVAGITLATEHHPDAAAEADRLLAVAVRGISPER